MAQDTSFDVSLSLYPHQIVYLSTCVLVCPWLLVVMGGCDMVVALLLLIMTWLAALASSSIVVEFTLKYHLNM